MSFINAVLRHTLFLSLCTLIACWQPFPDATVGEYDDQCADALSTNLTSCIEAVRSLSSNNFYSQHGLDLICTSDCRDELQAYEESVAEGCPGVTYTNDWGTVNPISEIASTLAFQFQQTCLKNGGKHCNLILGNLTQNGGNECNKCLLLKLRQEAQFPYGSGPEVYSSVYPSFTSSCGFTGYPVTHSPTATPSPSSSATPTPSSSAVPTPTAGACTGQKYTIKEGDTCQSVSKSQSVATFQLLLDNGLQAYCANFPKRGDLCIKSQCTTYTVQKGDTCKSVAKAHKISTVQLRSYNPWIDGGCYNFNRTIGTEICMDEPGDKYHVPSTATAPPTATATTPVPVPTNAAGNSTKTCGEYYSVKDKEDCDTIVQKFPITRENFLILNPGVGQNCTNLIAGRSYCVEPVGDMDNYPGAPGYIPPISKAPWDSLPDATYTPILNPGVLPIAPGTLKDCQSLIDGRDLQYGFPGVSDCKAAQSFFNVTAADLLQWNPSLKDTKQNSTKCSFSDEYRYCLRKGSGAPSPIPVPSPTATSTSTSASTSSSSTATTTTTSTSSPAPTTGPTTTASTTTTTGTPTTGEDPTTTSGSIPSPTQTNSIPDNCSDYAKAKDGDNCVDFAKDNNITPEQLYEWNTVLGDGGKECGTMFQKDTYYCIGVSK